MPIHSHKKAILGYCDASLCSVRYITIIIKKGEAVKMCVHLLGTYIYSDKKHFKRWDADFLRANINVSQQMQCTLRPIMLEKPEKSRFPAILNWFQTIYQRGCLHLPILHDCAWQIYAKHGWMFPPSGLKTQENESCHPGFTYWRSPCMKRAPTFESQSETTNSRWRKTHYSIYFFCCLLCNIIN